MGRVNAVILFRGLITALMIFFILYPFGMIFYAGFLKGSPANPGGYDLEGFRRAYSNPALPRLIWTTLWLALCRSCISTTLAIAVTWIITRTNTPLRHFFERIFVFKFFLPYLPIILAWVLLFQRDVGMFNMFLERVIGLPRSPIDINSYGGIIFASVMGMFPFLIIFLIPAFRNVDSSLEEASRMSGASWFTTIWKIYLPLLRPAIFAAFIISFVLAIESFETELFLGFDKGIRVFTTAIFENIFFRNPPRFQDAMALSSALFLTTITLIVIQWKLLGTKEYTTISGKQYAVRPIDLGAWRYVTCGIVVAFLFLVLLLPLAVLVQGSFMKIIGYFQHDMYTLEYWKEALASEGLMEALKNTIIVAVVCATVGMGFCSVIAYLVVRTKFKERKLLDIMAWLPWAVPRLVLSLGFLWAFLLFPPTSFLYGTMGILIIALMIKSLPLGTRLMSTTMIQIHKELEESSWVHGASTAQTFWRILVPLLLGAFLSGWILLFTLAAKDLSTVILLYGPNSSVLSTVVFEHWDGGWMQSAVVVGLIQTLVLLVAYIVSQRFLSRLSRTVSYAG
ncbi:MAG: iron ABC transporter permease [Deltaproteobacteria bacterium]|nr:iron ABC transporter permease [Deltaproteobacteria bacterium]